MQVASAAVVGVGTVAAAGLSQRGGAAVLGGAGTLGATVTFLLGAQQARISFFAVFGAAVQGVKGTNAVLSGSGYLAAPSSVVRAASAAVLIHPH